VNASAANGDSLLGYVRVYRGQFVDGQGESRQCGQIDAICGDCLNFKLYG
jgi:hypothetical protein